MGVCFLFGSQEEPGSQQHPGGAQRPRCLHFGPFPCILVSFPFFFFFAKTMLHPPSDRPCCRPNGEASGWLLALLVSETKEKTPEYSETCQN